ncbi:MAG: hypothetical protein ACLVIY_02875 [Anaerobutyricum soehngenii]
MITKCSCQRGRCNIKKNPVFEAVLKGNKDGIVDVVKEELSKGTKPGEILDGLC